MSDMLSVAAIELAKRSSPYLIAACGLLFESLLRTYPHTNLELLLSDYSGGTWGQLTPQGIGYPVLRSTNMRGAYVDTQDVAWCDIPGETAKRFTLQSGDILITKSSGSSDLVGKSALFIHPNDGKCYLFSNFTLMLRPARTKVIPEFIAWFLRSPHSLMWRYDSQHTSVGLRNLKTKEFLAQNVPIPSLDIQSLIVNYLNLLEQGVKDKDIKLALPLSLNEQRRIVAHIEALAARIAEVCGLRQQTIEEAEALLASYTDEVLVELTSRFELCKFSKICTTITDGDHITPPFSNEGVKFIFVGNVSSGYLHFNNCKYVTEEYFATIRPQRVPKRGDILYSAVGATLGVPAIVDVDEPFCFQRHIAILKPDRDKLDSQYAWHLLQSGKVYQKAWLSTTGSAQPTIPLKAIRELEIPVPPISEQRRLVTWLDDLHARVDALKRLQTETAAELNALLPSVLDRAFRGELL